MNLDRWLSYSVRRAYLDRDLEMARPAMSGRVLEIGNGHQPRRGEFRPPVTEQWVTVDINSACEPDVMASVETLPFPAGVFDTVMMLEVLEYVGRPKTAFKELRRVTKVGGNLVVSVPFLHRADSDHDLWRFTDHGLSRLLAETGFAVTWIRPQGYAFAVVANILKHAVYVRPAGVRRRLLGHSLRALAALLLKWDGSCSARFPTLQTFSTGYLVVASAIGDREELQAANTRVEL